MQNLRKKYSKETIDDHHMAITGGTESDILRCGKCKQNKCTYNQVRIRALSISVHANFTSPTYFAFFRFKPEAPMNPWPPSFSALTVVIGGRWVSWNLFLNFIFFLKKTKDFNLSFFSFLVLLDSCGFLFFRESSPTPHVVYTKRKQQDGKLSTNALFFL